jgi:hypothetical protein
LSASLAEKQNARNLARAQHRHMAAERKHQEAKRRAEWQEQRDEQIAPAVQRLPVLDRNGDVIRGARVERDGVVFVRSNPIRRMVALGSRKEHPLLTKRHADAADRLLAAWTEAGAGVTFGIANYGVRLCGTPQTGMISDGVLRGVNRQIDARTELEAVKTVLGARWGTVFSVVITGLDVTKWGAACRMNPATACGYIAACMDTLADFYAPPEQTQRIRVVEFASPGGVREAAD